jgi:hypothetical protein
VKPEMDIESLKWLTGLYDGQTHDLERIVGRPVPWNGVDRLLR